MNIYQINNLTTNLRWRRKKLSLHFFYRNFYSLSTTFYLGEFVDGRTVKTVRMGKGGYQYRKTVWDAQGGG